MATQWAFADDVGFSMVESDVERGSWDLSTGTGTKNVTFRGPRALQQTFVEAVLAQTVVPQKIEYTTNGDVVDIVLVYQTEQPDGSATVPVPPDPIFEAWTLHGNTGNRPLLEMNRFTPINGVGFTAQVIADILSQVRLYKAAVELAAASKNPGEASFLDIRLADYTAGLDAYLETTFSLQPADIKEALKADGIALFERLAISDDSFEVIQPVIRRVAVLTKLSQVRASWQNVGRFMTLDALKRFEPTITADVLIGLDALEELNGTAPYYWRKQVPVLEVQSDGKRQLSQEYWGAEGFDTWRYGALIT